MHPKKFAIEVTTILNGNAYVAKDSVGSQNGGRVFRKDAAARVMLVEDAYQLCERTDVRVLILDDALDYPR